MKIMSLSCNGCGAPLDATSETRFITCQVCEARLQVVHEGTTVRTEDFVADEEVRALKLEIGRASCRERV